MESKDNEKTRLARVIEAVREKVKADGKIKRPEVIRITMNVYNTGGEMCWGVASTTDKALRVLREEGLICRIGRGVYMIKEGRVN